MATESYDIHACSRVRAAYDPVRCGYNVVIGRAYVFISDLAVMGGQPYKMPDLPKAKEIDYTCTPDYQNATMNMSAEVYNQKHYKENKKIRRELCSEHLWTR